MTQQAQQAAQIIQQQCPDFKGDIAVVLGSGLGPLAQEIENATVIPYTDLPGFPQCGVAGHAGQLFLGQLHGKNVVGLQGRAHYYEGDVANEVKTLIRTAKLLGCDTLLSTNASGSLRPEVKPGDLVVIRDHINMLMPNPLSGPNDDEFGPRFVGMEDTYDPALREQLLAIGMELGITISEGVYFAVMGPMFETPSEIKTYRQLGAEVIGMSTVPEVIVARHCGMRVAVVAAICNMAAGMSDERLSHELTLSGAKKAIDKMMLLVQTFLQQYQP